MIAGMRIPSPRRPERPPDHVFWADVCFPRKTPIRTRAELFLPTRATDELELFLITKNLVDHRLDGPGGFCDIAAEFPAEMASPGAERSRWNFLASHVHIGGGPFVERGNDLSGGWRQAYPESVSFVRRWREPARWGSGGTEGHFLVTPSLHLRPDQVLRPSRKGTVEVDRRSRFSFDLRAGVTLAFETRYHSDRIDRGDDSLVLIPELVAEFSCPEALDPISMIGPLEDLLLLTSFAEGRRCAARSLFYSAPWGEASFYLNRSAPKRRAAHSFNDFLIYEDDFEEFARTAFDSLASSPNAALLRRALQILVSDAELTIESKFSAVFTALETAILSYRRLRGLEFILPVEKERSSLRKDIQRFVKTHRSLACDRDRRALIYKNLSGLDRIPLRDVVELFCCEHSVELDDLWPLWGSGDPWSLAEIRNRLVHGEHFEEWQFEHVMRATYCLRRAAERILLASLGWKFARSRAHFLTSGDEARWRKAYAALTPHP